MSDFGFVLHWPWSVLDRRTSWILDGRSTVELDPASAFMLALPANFDWRVRRGRARLEPEGPDFRLGSRCWRVMSLPVPRDARELEITLAAGAVVQVEQAIRHSPSIARESGLHSTAPGDGTLGKIDPNELVGLVELLHDASHQLPLGHGRLKWDDVADTWLMKRSEAADARRALIVSHADALESLIVALAERPRRVLVRRRRLVSVGRVQELDRACIGWYVRQPGLTTAEKAGPRQRVLSVVREESRDTLENRVLHETLRLSARTARVYTDANQRFQGRPRVAMVRRYGQLCRSLAHELSLHGVTTVSGLPTPNYPLLFDSRYRQIWQAYRELLREEETLDEAWRWQRRLWADIVRIAAMTSLTRPKVEGASAAWAAAQSPLNLRDEQARGRWSTPAPAPMRVVLSPRTGEVLVEPIDLGAFAGDAVLPEPLAELDALVALNTTLLLRLEHLSTGQVAWLALWAVWPGDVAKAGDMLASVERALDQASQLCALESGKPHVVSGLVVQAAAPGSSADYQPGEQAWSLTIPLDERGFSDGVYLLRNTIDALLGKVFEP